MEQQCEYTKCHGIVHLNIANFMLSKFHLNLKTKITNKKTGRWAELVHGSLFAKPWPNQFFFKFPPLFTSPNFRLTHEQHHPHVHSTLCSHLNPGPRLTSSSRSHPISLVYRTLIPIHPGLLSPHLSTWQDRPGNVNKMHTQFPGWCNNYMIHNPYKVTFHYIIYYTA